ncbi:MAG: cytidylate kinase [Crocinitomicaceae bacterium]
MDQSNKITIAIDGFSSCGKSTLARELARSLHYVFIDSGAMYRGVTLHAIRTGCIVNKEINRRMLIHSLSEIELKFQLNPDTKTPELLLNGENVEQQIRTPEVSSFVSPVAAIKEVRTKLVAEQRSMGMTGGIVMDGRDIGSVVFPNAELKLFITADMEVRVERRYQELLFRKFETTRDEVRANLSRRDHIDSTRKESPLTQTDDAIVIDNTDLSREEQLGKALDLVEKALTSIA